LIDTMAQPSLIQAVVDEPFQFLGLMVALLAIIIVRMFVKRGVARNQQARKSFSPSGTVKITKLFVYPIKSCKGIEVSSSKINSYGFEYDRNWMVVRKPEDATDEEEYRFVTQRQFPKMSLISPQIVTRENSVYLILSAPSMQDIEILVDKEGKNQKQVEKSTLSVVVWKNSCRGIDEGTKVSAWLSSYLGTDVKLVRIPFDHDRKIPEESAFGGPQNLVGYADGFPFLLASEESLDCLNLHLRKNGSKALPITRFRPNVIIKAEEGGGEPFMEDSWLRIKIGEISFRLVKKCVRCKLTTVDPDKGEFAGDEPLRTLSTFRKGLLEGKDEVCFGQNMCADQSIGFISVGMQIHIID